MSRKNNALPEEQQAKLIEMLNRRLADAINLQLQSRQAYWNVKGPHFMSSSPKPDSWLLCIDSEGKSEREWE